MRKPTLKELLRRTKRGGRVFLFDFPSGNAPSYESIEHITEELDKLPGCKRVEGPFVNGVFAVTINDADEEAARITDDEFRLRIASVIHQNWRERK